MSQKIKKYQEKLDTDKRQHETLKFPLDLETEGTRNIFLININAISGSKFNGTHYQTVQGGEEDVVYQGQTSNSLARKFTGNYVRTTSSIALFMPEDVQSDYKSSWSSTDLGITGSIMDAWAGKGDLTTMEGWESVGKQVANSAGDVAKMNAVKVANTITPFNVKDAYQLSNAIVENPYTEVMFKGVDNRTFEYSFKLMPRNREEQLMIKKIVDTLKFHRAPEKKVTGNNLYWSYPSTFDLSFLKSDGQENEWLFKHSTCAMTGLSIKQGGDGFYSSYTDGSPFYTTVSMSFTELEILDKDRILEGY